MDQNMGETTCDAFLGGRLMLRQPKKGQRAGSDAILLAAAIEARAGQRAIELGAGMGPAALALAHRVSGVEIIGLELVPALVALAQANAVQNGLSEHVRFICADVTALPLDLDLSSFDHVFANPPFFDSAAHSISPHTNRRLARSADKEALGDWVKSAADLAKPDGTLTIIWRWERRMELLSHLEKQFGHCRLLPLIAQAGEQPKRFLLKANRNKPMFVETLPPLILHQEDGRYRPEIDCILRTAAPLRFNLQDQN